MATLVEDTKKAVLVLHEETKKEWISLKEIYQKVEEIRQQPNANNGASIRAVLETHCKLSDTFLGEELFILKEKGTGLYKSIEYEKEKNAGVDLGVRFVLENFEKAMELAEQEKYKELKNQIEFEYGLIKYMKKTGDAYDHFLKFADEKHKYAEKFKVLDEKGLLSNEKISEYLLKNFPDEIENRTSMDDFIINNVYSNSELYMMFNNFISGIRYNQEKNIIAVVTSQDSLYADSWNEDGILYYTGEGQTGDQSITSFGNKALMSANNNKSKIYLFDKVTTNKFYYRGEVFISGSIKTTKEVDKKGNIREVLKFPLKFVDENTELIYSEEDKLIIEKEQNKKIDSLSDKQLHDLAVKKDIQPIKKIVEMNYVERDQVISRYTKNRANGKCDLCEQDAPFKTKDGPYLECHHVITIAEGGPDVIYNTVALCPNCHRKIHSLKDPKDLKKLTEVIYNYLLSDDDKENMKKWEELFKND